jgi:muramoyltetrapeptide carboxypeptidase
MPHTRRHFLAQASLGSTAATAATAATVAAATAASPRSASASASSHPAAQAGTPPWPTLYPPRLKPGDTIALVNPSSAIHEREPYAVATESLQALGFKVREAPHLRARYGHFAGSDAQRAADVNAMFADPSVHGILALTGGSGGGRVVDKIDYEAVRRQPKFFGGFSDLTALVNAIHRHSGLVTFHCPMGASEWNEFSVQHFRAAVMQGEAALLKNPPETGSGLLVPKEGRISTLRGGKAQGRLVGGNLAVLTALAGSPYMPSFEGAILFLEDVNEYIYRVDRMLSTLRLSGALAQVKGVVLGAFTRCEPGEGFGSLTLDEVFDDYFLPLNVPVYRGAMFGHIRRKFTLPVGLACEMDADAGTLRFLRPAVA